MSNDIADDIVVVGDNIMPKACLPCRLGGH